MAKAIHKEAKFIKVEEIKEPGEYKFAGNPNLDITKEGSMVYGEYPMFLYEEINFYLKEKFPQISSQEFIPASLDDGKYTPAGYKFCDSWDRESDTNREEFRKFIVYDAKVHHISLSLESFGYYYTIRDVGNLSIIENKLRTSKPDRRSGELELMILSINQSIMDHPKPKKWWGSINYKGEHSGKLIKAAIKYINLEKKKLNAPLWKKTK